MQKGSEIKKAVYAGLNKCEEICPDEIKKQAVCMDGDIGEILEKLR